MRTKNFAVDAVQPRQQLNILGTVFSVLVLPVRSLWNFAEYLARLTMTIMVAVLLETDLKSAALLIYMYRGMEVFIDEDGEVERIEQDVVHPPLDPKFVEKSAYTIPFDDEDDVEEENERDEALEIAMDAMVDFTLSLFEEEGRMKENGELTKGTIAPWVKRANFPGPAKEKMKMIIARSLPRMFFKNVSNLWQYNTNDYPDSVAARNELLNVYRTWE